MASNKLIQQIAVETGWSQADIKRAIQASDGEVGTREELVMCLLRYAGPVLLERNRALAAQRRVNQKQQEKIEDLVNQVKKIQRFYAEDMVPELRVMIREQAEYILALLEEYPSGQQEK